MTSLYWLQIDSRVLRAVAIEHSKDADAAVEAVLVEIIPFFSERSRPGTPPIVSISEGKSYEGEFSSDCNAQIILLFWLFLWSQAD